MALERTLSIIKPDGVERNLIGKILAQFEENGLKIVAAELIKLNQATAEQFYDVHKERPFYRSLVSYMTSGPVFVSVLEGENAITRHREILGATNPKEAKPGTVRALYGVDVEKNTTHGSDSEQTARREVAFFFPEL